MIELFHSYVYQPIFLALVFIYQNVAFEDLGLAVIILTILVRVVLLPFFYKSSKDQALMSKLQPYVKKIQVDHKDDKEKQARKLMELYRKYKFNPFSSFFLILIQLPIFIALFRIFTREVTNGVFGNPYFFSFVNLSESNIVLAVGAAVGQYFQIKLATTTQKEGSVAGMAKTMTTFMPIFAFFILMYLPSALALYWIVTTIFGIAQQIYANKRLPDIEIDEKKEKKESKKKEGETEDKNPKNA